MKKVLIPTIISALMIVINGCGPAIGLVMDILPKPDIPAKYTMEDKNVLVFVASLTTSETGPVFSHALSDQVTSELVKNKAVASTVKFSQLSDLMLNTSDMITAEYAGRELGADLILKIEIQHLTFDYRSADNCRVGQALCFVSVLDGKTGKRYWPEDKIKESLMINSKLEINADDKLSLSKIQRDLAKNASLQISKLFYKHKDE